MATETGMNKKELQALKTVVEYLRENEEENYNEMLENGEDAANHIYLSVKTLINYHDRNC